jgi:hypothetical protein
MVSSGAFVLPETHAQGWRLAALMLGGVLFLFSAASSLTQALHSTHIITP